MHELESIEVEGRTWRVRADRADAWRQAGWPPARPEGLALVKRGRGRAVYRFDCGGQGYVLKAWDAVGLGRRLRVRLGLGPARREFEALRAARAAGLDVPEPVALAAGTPERLVTVEVPGAQRLDAYLYDRYFVPVADEPPYPGARPPELVAVYRARRQPPPGTVDPATLARLLGALVADLAEAGWLLPDLHPGNLLIAGPPGAWRLVPVDWAEARRAAPAAGALRHLVALEHFFEPLATPAERLRTLRTVEGRLGRAPGPRRVVSRTAAYRRVFYAKRDRRARRRSKYFTPVEAGGYTGWATADRAADAAALVADGDPAARPDTVAVKEGRTGSVYRTATAQGEALYVKRHHAAGARGRGRIRASRSVAAFRRGHALLNRGIATARPAAALDRRGPAGGLSDTLLITEPVAGGIPLPDWLKAGPPASRRRRVTRHLAHLVRRLHEAGFSHRDLKAPNLLVAPADGDAARPVLVDLDGLRHTGHVGAGRRARDLMRLSVALEEWGVARATDRLRFLRAYLGGRGRPAAVTVRHRGRGDRRPAERLRAWWHRIERLSEPKRQALRRKGANPTCA